jgi:membrane protein DedA with SNARE-associated domain/rhodanese-related sulfurtransferase
MHELLYLVASYGLLVVFVSVLVDQGGIPIPAYPALVVTSALAVDRGASVWPIVVVSVVAALMADLLWFAGGRRFGNRLLQLMCRISLSPDSCVLSTRGIFARWGVRSLMVAKFMPGFAAVATVLAGESGVAVSTFLVYDGIGALLWSVIGVALGVIFHGAVNQVLESLATFGHVGSLVVLALIALFIAWKWWRRRRFIGELRLARVSSAELLARIQAGDAPLILDVRRASHREASGWIPGSVHAVTLDEAAAHARAEVIVYCDCPNEASAATLAAELKKRGFGQIRPLAGGFDGWRDQGNPVVFARA